MSFGVWFETCMLQAVPLLPEEFLKPTTAMTATQLRRVAKTQPLSGKAFSLPELASHNHHVNIDFVPGTAKCRGRRTTSRFILISKCIIKILSLWDQWHKIESD